MWPIDWVKASEIIFKSLLIGLLAVVIEHRLTQSLFEYQTKFTELHKRRADVIAELYRLLVQVQHSLSSMAHTMDSDILKGSKWEKRKAANESIDEFSRYFEENRIYLPGNLGSKIEKFHLEALKTNSELLLANISQELEEDEEYAQRIESASKSIADKISPIRQDIEKEFRRMLGNTDGATNAPFRQA